MVSGNYPQAFKDLLARLVAYKVHVWHGTSRDPDMSTDREVATLSNADVVSSKIGDTGKHIVAIDIDHPCFLVKSTTPGHFHLYIDVPGGIEWPMYRNLLRALGTAGVVEAGYVRASIERGATMVRLPWVKKPTGAPPIPVSQPPPPPGETAASAAPFPDDSDWGF